ncbi:MAG: nitrate- and nitrite sensing domain-containing protein [Acidimicrobiia bacterium]|nr:MAG: nitrate- and nitrite sensing domain-containing protein [Acidimicrobiia bacterium]
MSVATKLVVMVLIPLLAVLALLVVGIADKVEDRRVMNELAEAADLASVTQGLVIELQRERGRSSVYLTTRSAGDLAGLLAQHQATDAAGASYSVAIAGMATSIGSLANADIGAELLASVAEVRARVLSFEASTTEVVSFYSTRVEGLQDASLLLVAASGEDPELDVSLALWALIVEAGEAAGMERALVAADLADGAGFPSPESLVIVMRQRQDAALATFRSALDPAMQEEFREHLTVLDSPVLADLRLRADEDPPSVTPAEWFAATTERIDAMAAIGDALLDDVRVRGHALARSAEVAAIWFLVLGLLVVAAALFVAVRVARHIVGRIKALVTVTRAIREGDLDLRADVTGSDELSELAEAFNAMTADIVEVNRSLERQVAERTRHLEAAVRSKDELIASISHEVRTPLTAVLGFAEVLRSEGTDLTEGERTGMIESIAVEAGDMAEIIEDLLVAARADIGNLRVDRVEFELRSLVARVVESCRPCPQSANLTGDETWAIGDPGRVRQVVRNLLTNAVRYGGERVGVEVTVSEASAFVRVRDNGPGVAEDDPESVFDAYHRAPSYSEQPAAVGLGLTVSRSLARLMGGDLVYRREDGQTVFELSLPAAPRPAVGPSEGLAS